MAVSKNVIQGTAVSKNGLPEFSEDSQVILKGKFCGNEAKIGLTKDILSKHMLLVGETGCGKSTLFYHIIEQIKSQMTDDDVMIVFDSKGDFYSRFNNENKDYVIGNSGKYFEKSQKWNILEEIVADGWSDNQMMLNAVEICKSLFEERTAKNSSNPFFPNAARDLFTAFLVMTIRMSFEDENFRAGNFNNQRIKEVLDCATTEELCEMIGQYQDMKAVLSYISGDNSQSQGVVSEMYSVIRDVFMGVFCERGDFSMRKFVREKGGRTLFIEYDLAIGDVLTPVYRILFDLALKEALGRRSSNGNVYLICDEFKLLPNLKHIDDGVNFGRSLGVKVFAGIQSMEQLYEIYGNSRGRNLAAGFSTIVAFRANDVTTRDYIASLYGKNMVIEQYQINNSYTEEKRIGMTVEDWDLNSLGIGEAIVGLPFTQPFRFYFDEYRGNN